MRRTRPLAAVTAMVAAAVYVAWLGFTPQTTHDYGRDYAPAMNALLGGHVRTFLALAPDDGAGGSLVLRLPGALAGKLLVGGQLAIFRFGALECLLLLGGLGLYLARRLRRAGRGPLEQAAVAGLCVLTPLILDAILYGHPEEALGALLSVAAVLLAGRGRGGLAGVVLGLAVLAKPWGLLAAAPALLCAPPGSRLRLLAAAAAPLALWAAVCEIVLPGSLTHQVSGRDVVAHPVDVWWPLSHLEVLASGARYHLAPPFLIDHGRQLAVLAPLLLAVPLALRERRTASGCLALLALMFALRCALDYSNHVYYEVPFLLALLAYEAEAGRAPLAPLLAAACLFLTFHTVAAGSLALQFWVYLGLTGAITIYLIRPATGSDSSARAWSGAFPTRRSGMIST